MILPELDFVMRWCRDYRRNARGHLLREDRLPDRRVLVRRHPSSNFVDKKNLIMCLKN